MSIVRLSRTYPRDNYPGIGLHCYNFSRYIDLPTIIFTKKMIGAPIDIPPNVDFQEIGYSDLSFKREKESVIRLFAIMASKIFGELVFSWCTVYYLKKNETKVEIVHLHSINYLLTAVLIKVLFQAPMVMNFGGTDLLRMKKYKILQWLANRSSKILYVAKSMENDLLNYFSSEQLRHMNNGVDLKHFVFKEAPRKKQFLAVGNLRWQKGYSFLISAFKKVIEVDPSFTLLIAGEGNDREELEKQINKLGLTDKVKLLGMQDRNSIIELMSTSLAFVMSSVSEGLPKALIEAIACATPVVVTDAGDCSYIAKDVGIVVPPRDIDSLSEALVNMALDTESWEGYKNKCLLVRETYDWKYMTECVFTAYKEVLNPI